MPDRTTQITELRARVRAGETELLDDLLVLLATPQVDATEPDDTPDPIMERMRVKKRTYTMTPAALQQRHNASAKSTGPRTPEGKAAGSAQNAWKHGKYARKKVLTFGKPCKSTCAHYPCSLVDDGDTKPGQQCLDKEYLVHTIRAVTDDLRNGTVSDTKDIVALQLASTLQVIEELQSSILEYGVYLKSEKIDKEGNVIGHEIKPNPSLLPLSHLLKSAGVTLPDFMLTPAALERKKSDETAAVTIADLFRTAGTALKEARMNDEGGRLKDEE